MLRNYRYKWDRGHKCLNEFEINRNGSVYKKILSNSKCYTIIKYTSKNGDKFKSNTLIYKVRIWERGCYRELGLFKIPRQAINFINEHSKDIMFLFA